MKLTEQEKEKILNHTFDYNLISCINSDNQVIESKIARILTEHNLIIPWIEIKLEQIHKAIYHHANNGELFLEWNFNIEKDKNYNDKNYNKEITYIKTYLALRGYDITTNDDNIIISWCNHCGKKGLII
jgi:hypothetical protein